MRDLLPNPFQAFVLSVLSVLLSFPEMSGAGHFTDPELIGSLRTQQFSGEAWLIVTPADGAFDNHLRVPDTDEFCSPDRESGFAMLNTTDPLFDYYYSMLLGALLSGSQVRLFLDDCFSFFGWHPIVSLIEVEAP